MRIQKVPWLICGPEPHLATCLRCGRTVPKPPLPMRFTAAVKYTEAFIQEHRGCPPMGREE